MNEENHMIQPYADDEPLPELPEAPFEREIEHLKEIDARVKDISILTRISAVLYRFHNNDTDIDEMVDILEKLERIGNDVDLPALIRKQA